MPDDLRERLDGRRPLQQVLVPVARPSQSGGVAPAMLVSASVGVSTCLPKLACGSFGIERVDQQGVVRPNRPRPPGPQPAAQPAFPWESKAISWKLHSESRSILFLPWESRSPCTLQRQVKFRDLLCIAKPSLSMELSESPTSWDAGGFESSGDAKRVHRTVHSVFRSAAANRPIARNGPSQSTPSKKSPEFRQQRLNSRPLPHGHRSRSNRAFRRVPCPRGRPCDPS